MTATGQPAISICIPAYNQTTYLSRLFDSIKSQDFADFELIVSDDSTTQDVQTLAEKAGFGEKLRYFRNQPALGSPANWNAAISRATGKYIKIMHHDDAFANPSSLSQMFSFANERNLDWIFCDTQIRNVQDASVDRVHLVADLEKLKKKPWLLFFGNSIGAPTTLLIRSGLRQLQYDPQYIWLVDTEYYMRLLRSGTKGARLARPLVITHDAIPERLTSSILANFDLQLKENVMLYERESKEVSKITRFFMQVFLARLLLRSGMTDRRVINYFSKAPALVKAYFATKQNKIAFIPYYTFIRALDLFRKILY